MASDPSRKLTKLLQRLRLAVDNRQFYEAHQLYKTVYFRWLSQKNYDTAIQYLIEGSNFLLDNKQWESGTDVAGLVINVFAKSGMELTPNHVEILCNLHRKMHPTGPERAQFVSNAVGLLKSKPQLYASFSEYLGQKLWQEQNYTEARQHLIKSENGFATGCLLIEFHLHCGYRSEIDMFIVQAVLQFLCMQKLAVAAITFYTYTRRHPNLEAGPPYTTFPLLNFVWFLMLAIERKCTNSVFLVLCEKYNSQLKRDPAYLTYLDKIGQLYFGVPPPNNQPSGEFFSSIMNLLTADMNSDGDADVTMADQGQEEMD